MGINFFIIFIYFEVIPIKAKTIIFLGPDGAGKSTLLAQVERDLKAQNLNIFKTYFTPGFFKRFRPGDDVKVTQNPHGWSEHSFILKIAKVALLFLEFTLGVQSKKSKYDAILFDRFFHDILVDPVRYRLGSQPSYWIKLIAKICPKPDLAVIVTAPVDVIQARKQEVSASETSRQLDEYLAFETYFKKTIVVENTGDIIKSSTEILKKMNDL